MRSAETTRSDQGSRVTPGRPGRNKGSGLKGPAMSSRSFNASRSPGPPADDYEESNRAGAHRRLPHKLEPAHRAGPTSRRGTEFETATPRGPEGPRASRFFPNSRNCRRSARNEVMPAECPRHPDMQFFRLPSSPPWGDLTEARRSEFRNWQYSAPKRRVPGGECAVGPRTLPP